MAPTAEQKVAKAKLEAIAADIKAGKISFEDAAKQYSQDIGSKDSGGDLGEFTFDKMVPQFAIAAFDAKPGEMSPIIRTKYGFHLIQVSDHKTGKDEPGAISRRVARAALVGELESGLLALPLTTCPVVVNK